MEGAVMFEGKEINVFVSAFLLAILLNLLGEYFRPEFSKMYPRKKK